MVEWNKKNVLITGVGGFLAPHIAKLLVEKGANIVGTLHDSKKDNFLSIEGLDDLITTAVVDINDFDRVKEVIANYEIDYIFHCAAHSIVRTCINNPIGAFQANIIGTANILEAARQVGGVSGVMCMESDKSYGSFDKNDLPYKEDQQIKPTNVYEVSKACSGLISDAYSHNYNLPIFSVRAANLYGPGDMNISRIIPGSILRLISGGKPILYSGVANYVREFLYVTDATNAIVSLMENIDLTKSNVYNIGSNSIHNISEVLKILADKFPDNSGIEIVEKNSMFKEIEEQYVDYSKLQSIVSEYNPRSLQDGIEETIEWYSLHSSKFVISN
jgi:CDP-glucose 4,6-dehydratase